MSYLTDRKQQVEIEHYQNNTEIKVRSNIQETKSGIPQGSVLGPLLFLIYINSFPSILSGERIGILFADDTTVISPVETDEKEEAEKAFYEASLFCDTINLQINKSKTVHITFTPNQPKPPENVHHGNINEVTTTKFLGITLDSQLSWNSHIEILHKRLSSALFALRRIRSLTNKTTARKAYHALFESHLQFGIITWGSGAQTQLQEIFTLQKKCY